MTGLIGNPTDQVLVWSLNVLIQVGCIAAFASLASLMLRRAPVKRYCLLCSALILICASPLLSTLIQSTGMNFFSVALVQNPPAPTTVSTQPAASSPHILRQNAPESFVLKKNTNQVLPEEKQDAESSLTGNSDKSTIQQAAPQSVTSAAISATAASNSAKVRPTITGYLLQTIILPALLLWSFISLFLLIQLAMKWYRLALLLKSANVNTDKNLTQLFQRTWQSLEVSQNRNIPELVLSEQISGPFAAGIWSPKVVLPEALLQQVYADQMREILIHELAHIARRDQIVVLLQTFIGTLFWAHPLVRLLNRQLAEAREEVCDNYVLTVTDAPSYSRTLLTMAQILNTPRPIPGTVGLFTSRWKLEQRIIGLLDEQRCCVTRLNKRTILLISILSAGIASMAAFGTVSLAVAEKAAIPPRNKKPDQTAAPERSTKQEVAEENAKTDDAENSHFVYTGRIVDSQGHPIAGATLYVDNSQYHSKHRQSNISLPVHKQLTETLTNSDGTFRLEFDDLWTRVMRASTVRPAPFYYRQHPGTLIIATAPGYATEWITTTDADPAVPLKITLSKSAAPIRGRLVDLEGRGLAGITVSVEAVCSAEEGAVDRWLHDLPTLSQQGLLPNEKKKPKPGSYNASIGKYPGASMVTANTPGFPTSIETDQAGRFQFLNIGIDRLLILKIEGPQVATERIAVVSRDMQSVQARPIGYEGPVKGTHYGATFTHVTEPSLVVEGTVRDRETGAPISARLKIRQSVQGSMNEVEISNPHTDLKGRYRIEQLPYSGTLRLYVIPDVDQPYFSTDYLLPKPSGLKPISLNIKLRRGVMFHGTITDKETGKPIPNASFDYFPLLSNKNATHFIPYQDNTTSLEPMQNRFISAEDGSFSLIGMPGAGIIGARTFNTDHLLGIGQEKLHHLIDENRDDRYQTHDYCFTNLYQVVKLITVPTGESEFQIDLQADRGIALQFEVVGPDGKPLTNYTINHHHYPGTAGEPATIFGFHPQRTQTIYFRHLQQQLGRAVTIYGVPEDRSIRKVKLEPLGSVKGQLLTAKGEPDIDAPISLAMNPPPGTDTLPNYDTGSTWMPKHCDSEGNFLFHDLMVGAIYTLRANRWKGRGYYPLPVQIKIKPGQKIDLGVTKVPDKK
ncbi:M56 family metallopeptidase [Gimesia fumaroli]|uniref:Regulatory protein BlaR1 n=1 Tax=Gimesia fumaroli TaxID=2527976 RepID=A0A518IFU5_9PLAN|nr:M56 family metallopeptidase [Gimesia fumaroli]QDV51956.1 Regulatory protein BlaR1 [Gimesia fumaroli]